MRGENERYAPADDTCDTLPPWESTLGPEITPLLDIHMRVHRERPDQLLVTRMELGGHWIEFGSPAEQAEDPT